MQRLDHNQLTSIALPCLLRRLVRCSCIKCCNSSRCRGTRVPQDVLRRKSMMAIKVRGGGALGCDAWHHGMDSARQAAQGSSP